MNTQKTVTKKVTTKRNPPRTGKSKNTKKKNNANQKLRQRVGIHLSPCSQKYLLALTDVQSAHAPCIPDMISIPSLKFSVKNRGQFAAGTQGFGYILCNPSALAYNDGIALSAAAPAAGAFPPGIILSSTAYTEVGFKLAYGAGALTAGLTQSNGNSSFSRAALNGPLGAATNLVKYRLVGASISISYIGTELNVSGIVTSSFTRGSDSSIVLAAAGGPLGSTDILRDPSAHFKGESSFRRTHFINFFPTDPEWDFGYNTLTDRVGTYVGASSSVSASHDGYSLFLGVSGVPASTPYMFETIAHFEAIGPILPTYSQNFGVQMTPSEIDPTGHAMVLNAINSTMTSLGDAVMDDPLKFAQKTMNVVKNVGTAYSALSYITGALGMGSPTVQTGSIVEI